MTHENAINNDSRLREEAARWLVRLRSDTSTKEDKRQFSIWLNQSQAHIDAFDEALSVWESTSAVVYLPLTDELKDSKAMPSAGKTVRQKSAGLGLKHLSWPARGLTYLCGVIIITAITIGLMDRAPSDESQVKIFNTAAGEVKRVQLPDGSTVELNTQSSLSVNYTQTQRALTLRQGEAYFKVRSEKLRPFIVNVGSGSVRAVGTEFNIYRKPADVSVTVTEGMIEVQEHQEAAMPRPARKRLVEGQQIRFNPGGLGDITSIDSRNFLAWRESSLIFENLTLDKAIAELNRYLDAPVAIDKTSLSSLKVSGTFSTENPQATLNALITNFSLSVEHNDATMRLYLDDK